MEYNVKIWVIGAIGVIILLVIALAQPYLNPEIKIIGTQKLTGPFNPEIITFEKQVGGSPFIYQIVSYEMNETKMRGTVYPEHAPALAWIRQNIPPHERIVAWWDYGHEIRIIGGHEPVADNPDAALLPDIAAGLIATDADNTRAMMNRVSGRYLFIGSEDSITDGKGWIYSLYAKGYGNEGFTSLSVRERIDSATMTTPIQAFHSPEVPDDIQKATVTRALNGDKISGLSYAYSDDFVVILKNQD
jgi:asparagine N-glycosylation enzyme membrane subunit Stt3